MKRCRNCDLATLATRDWACPWCGAPLRTDKRLEISYAEAVAQRRVPAEEPEVDEPGPESVQKEAPGRDFEPGRDEVSRQAPEEAEEVLQTEDEEEYLNQAAGFEPQQDVTEPPGQEAAEPKQPEKPAEPAEKPAEPQAKPEEEKPEEEEERVIILGPGPEPCIPDYEPEPEPVQKEKAEEPQEEEQPAEPEEEPEQVVAIDITIEELLDAYKQDAAAAELKYDNNVMAITGTIAMVDINERRGIHCVALSGSDLDMFQSIRCVFNPDRVADLKGLYKGQVVTIKGHFKGSFTAVSLVDCRLA